jgi:hypothetical protein
MQNHLFTDKIIEILTNHFGTDGKTVFDLSPLIQYLNLKTKSANRGSKARSSFANLYAIYVLAEDYLKKDFAESGSYSQYQGADFSPLLRRMRELPFGSKLQNHALNNRTNDEFYKFFPNETRRPILRRVDIQKYWINESLLKINLSGKEINIAKAITDIIDSYAETKQTSFNRFIQDCERLKTLAKEDEVSIIRFIRDLISPKKDARIFEIVSYAVLKQYYAEQIIFIGWKKNDIHKEVLRLYKTGRTNANDGGIDFVMRPLGRFFQVTETLDIKKYFLDIDKIERYPISFVIKTMLPVSDILNHLKEGAIQQYSVESVVENYMKAIEEVINIPILLEIFDRVVKKGELRPVFDEIIRWSKTEFNYMSDDINTGGAVADDDDENF